MKFFTAVGKFFKDLFAPTNFKCLNCGRDVFDDTGFCPECAKLLPHNNGKTCPRCGVGIDGEETFCGHCAFDKVYFDKAYSAFSYEGIIKKAIVKMKFHNLATFATPLAYHLVELSNKHNLHFDVVTFAPMSKKSKRTRRYNQAQLLANAFCDRLGISQPMDALVKVKETSPQEKLNKQERKQNLVGAYKINADVKGKVVLVIDDVKTTGSTLNECAKVLKNAGATTVLCLTVASRKEKIPFELEDN
ncbi:MAG: ComF family protein [Clostridia bacterium]|nr:ComF family protein [Clostridia bacterium]